MSAIGLPLEPGDGGRFLASEKLDGSRYFGVWSLSEAARTCFGTEGWPAGRPVPQAFIEFELGSRRSVDAAASELRSKGYRLLHGPRTDPWGQTVARLQTKEGLLVGVSYVPWMHRRPNAGRKRPRAPARGPAGRGPGRRSLPTPRARLSARES